MGKILKNGPSTIGGRESLKKLKRYGLPKSFLKAIFHKFTWSVLEYFVPNDSLQINVKGVLFVTIVPFCIT